MKDTYRDSGFICGVSFKKVFGVLQKAMVSIKLINIV